MPASLVPHLPGPHSAETKTPGLSFAARGNLRAVGMRPLARDCSAALRGLAPSSPTRGRKSILRRRRGVLAVTAGAERVRAGPELLLQGLRVLA